MTGRSSAGRLGGRENNAASIELILLRLDRVDAALRDRLAGNGFADCGAARRLRLLTEQGASWLRMMMDEHGWPGRRLVGNEAADAAVRLVQHLEGQLPFQRRCLELIRAAAAAEDVPWRHVAYLTDTIRLNEGRPQLYGTKLGSDGGRLVPFPIEAPEWVDERRAAMGLEPLEQYTRRVRLQLPLFPQEAE